MPKRREKDPLEFYKGKLREANKRIKQLEQEVKALRKHEHQYEISQDEETKTDSEDTFIELKPLTRCEDCGKGYMEEFEIMDKVYGTCNVCSHRKRLK